MASNLRVQSIDGLIGRDVLAEWTPSVIGRLEARECECPASRVMLLFVMCAMALT
jgi:hypothetical protein